MWDPPRGEEKSRNSALGRAKGPGKGEKGYTEKEGRE